MRGFLKKVLANNDNQGLDKKEYEPQEEYYFFMKQLNRWLSDTPSKDDQLDLLDFLMDIIKRDLQVDLLTEVLYKEKSEITDLTRGELIPLSYVTQDGDVVDIKPDEEKAISLKDSVTIVIPWNADSLRSRLLKIKKRGFRYNKENHSPAYYYKELGVCYVRQGNHSIGSAIIQETGEVESPVYSIKSLFDNVHTDGKYWMNSHTDEPLRWSFKKTKIVVVDFRVAVLYELAKMKFKIEQ